MKSEQPMDIKSLHCGTVGDILKIALKVPLKVAVI
jgi:hypothetical protein